MVRGDPAAPRYEPYLSASRAVTGAHAFQLSAAGKLQSLGTASLGDRYRAAVVHGTEALLYNGQDTEKGVVVGLANGKCKKLGAAKFPTQSTPSAVVLTGEHVLLATYEGVLAYAL